MVSEGKSSGKGAKGVKGNPPKFIIVRRPLPPEGPEVKAARREQALDALRERDRRARLEEDCYSKEAEREVATARAIILSYADAGLQKQNKQSSDGNADCVFWRVPRERESAFLSTREQFDDTKKQKGNLVKQIMRTDFSKCTSNSQRVQLSKVVQQMAERADKCERRIDELDLLMHNIFLEGERQRLNEARQEKVHFHMVTMDQCVAWEHESKLTVTTGPDADNPDDIVWKDFQKYKDLVDSSTIRFSEELHKHADRTKAELAFHTRIESAANIKKSVKVIRSQQLFTEKAIRSQHDFVDNLLELFSERGRLTQARIKCFDPSEAAREGSECQSNSPPSWSDVQSCPSEPTALATHVKDLSVQQRVNLGGPNVLPEQSVLQFEKLVPEAGPIGVRIIPPWYTVPSKLWFVGVVIEKFPEHILLQWAGEDHGGPPNDVNHISDIYFRIRDAYAVLNNAPSEVFLNEDVSICCGSVPRYSIIQQQWWNSSFVFRVDQHAPSPRVGYNCQTTTELIDTFKTVGLPIKVYNARRKCMESKVLRVDKRARFLILDEVDQSDMASYNLSHLRWINACGISCSCDVHGENGSISQVATTAFEFQSGTVCIRFRNPETGMVCKATELLCHDVFKELSGVEVYTTQDTENVD